MKIPDIPGGARLTAGLLNKIIHQANAGANMRAGRGLSWKNLPGGSVLSLAAQEILAAEPAEQVLVYNQDTNPIFAYAPAGIVESSTQKDGPLLNQRVLTVRPPLARDAGDLVIASERIEPGGVGWAWCSGTCLVRLVRWYKAALLDKADILAGKGYALASIDGPLDIVWSQKTDSGDLIVSTEHWAVVRFNGRRHLRWFNSDNTAVPFGGAICLLKSATDGLFSGVLSARAPNSADTLTTSFINLGGTVNPGEYGKCTASIALALTKAAYNSLSTVGAEQSQLGLSTSGVGWTLIARMGSSPADSQQYAVVAPAAGSSAVYTLQIIGGNTLSDGSTAGIKWASSAPTSVPSLYNPNVDTTFIDGIGRADLYDGTTTTRVLVAHYLNNGGPFTQSLVAGMLPVTGPTKTVTLPLATDSKQTVTLYVPMSP